MNLRLKLLIAFLSLIIIPLLLLVLAAYLILTEKIEEKYSQQAELTLKALSQSTDFIFREMDRVTDSTIASSAIQDILKMPAYQSKDLQHIDYFSINQIQQNFRELLVNHPSVSNAFMYTLNNQGLIRIYAKESFHVLDFATLEKHPVYKAALARDGLPKWVGPYEYPELTGADPIFTQIRMVKDVDFLQNKGVLVVQVKSSGLDNIFRAFWNTAQTHNTRFYLINENGLIFFDSTYEKRGKNISSFIDGKIKFGSGYQSVRHKFAGTESIISSIGIGRENWRVVSVTSWGALTNEVARVVKWLGAIAAFCLFAALLFNLLILNRIIGSIIMIVRHMRRVEDGEMWVRVEEKGKDEVFMLTRGYNRLMSRIHFLFEQIKLEQQHKIRAEMQLLQAQIKPHFLFNTLESINVLAVQNQGRKVSQMVQRLGNILRISFADKEIVAIREEIEHLRSYLEIQKYRFEELFEFSISVPEDLLECEILKLTLQPLVENSIQHGFDGIDYVGKISITAFACGGKIIFEIADNGIGMDSDILAQFQYNLREQKNEVVDDKNKERRGLGVNNVADRIRIHYGKEYGIWICSEAGNGTTIRCVIPNSQWGEANETAGAFGRR
ncbi:MAG TPA: sensor histidine kinase [Bacilli bacterium]